MQSAIAGDDFGLYRQRYSGGCHSYGIFPIMPGSLFWIAASRQLIHAADVSFSHFGSSLVTDQTSICRIRPGDMALCPSLAKMTLAEE